MTVRRHGTSHFVRASRIYQLPQSETTIIAVDPVLGLASAYIPAMPLPVFREWKTGDRLDAKALKRQIAYVRELKQKSPRNISNRLLELSITTRSGARDYRADGYRFGLERILGAR